MLVVANASSLMPRNIVVFSACFKCHLLSVLWVSTASVVGEQKTLVHGSTRASDGCNMCDTERELE